jgi:hypothetical protein
MIWTDQVLKEAEKLSATNTTAEIASVYGVTPCTLRKAFSNYGITSASRERDKKDRRLARKMHREYGWTIAEIMEQLDRSYRFVRDSVDYQLALWPERWFRVKPKPMSVVHVQRSRGRRVPVQLSLFDQPLALAGMICPRLLLGALVEWFSHLIKKIDTHLPRYILPTLPPPTTNENQEDPFPLPRNRG